MDDDLLRANAGAPQDAARRAADAKARRAARKAARAAVPPPERDRAYDHLSLDDLRGLRSSLEEEEIRVGYWQRIIGVRLAAVRAGRADREPVADMTAVLPDIDDAGVDLPDLAELWSRPCDPADETAVARLGSDLEKAEARLADHRADLVRREELVTRELIARYREQPLLALQTLPGDPLQRRIAG